MGVARCDLAAFVTPRAAGAGAGADAAGEGGISLRDRAPRAGVEGHVVRSLVIHALDDVNFACLGPVWADHPESRPRAAYAAGHVVDVDDDKAELVGLLARYSDTGTPACGHAGTVHHHSSIVGFAADQPVLRRVIRLVLHKSIGRISGVPEGKLVEEVAFREVILCQDIPCPPGGGHDRHKAGKDGMTMHLDEMND